MYKRQGEGVVPFAPKSLEAGEVAQEDVEPVPVEIAGDEVRWPRRVVGRSSSSSLGWSRSTRHNANHSEQARTTADSSAVSQNKPWRATGFARNEALRNVPMESDMSSPVEHGWGAGHERGEEQEVRTNYNMYTTNKRYPFGLSCV